MVCVISGATHSMCMGFLVRLHIGALCGVGVLHWELQQSMWVWTCWALLRRDLALRESDRSGLCRTLVRVMLAGLVGLVIGLFVSSD